MPDEDYRLAVLRAAGHIEAAELLETLPPPAAETGDDPETPAAEAADVLDGPVGSIARMTRAYEANDAPPEAA